VTSISVSVCVCLSVRKHIFGVKGPDLHNILRRPYDYLTIMPKLRSTYDKCLIYKTSYEELNAIHLQYRNIV